MKGSAMSTSDGQMRVSGGAASPLYEPRVDPGKQQRTNVDPPSRLSPVPPKGSNPPLTRMPVKR